jgi:hypothetical protein
MDVCSLNVCIEDSLIIHNSQNRQKQQKLIVRVIREEKREGRESWIFAPRMHARHRTQNIVIIMASDCDCDAFVANYRYLHCQGSRKILSENNKLKFFTDNFVLSDAHCSTAAYQTCRLQGWKKPKIFAAAFGFLAFWAFWAFSNHDRTATVQTSYRRSVSSIQPFIQYSSTVHATLLASN